ncbi:hypothetical protein P3S68_016241 [Capsicum galapagoense]
MSFASKKSKNSPRCATDNPTNQPIDEVVGPSNKKRKVKDKLIAPLKRSAKNNTASSSIVQKHVAPSRAFVDEDETEDELEGPFLGLGFI